MKLFNDLIIRSLTRQDLPKVAAIHLRAFPKSVLSQLGFEAVCRFYEWQLIGPHEVVPLGVFVRKHLYAFCFGGIFHGAMSGFLKRNIWFLILTVMMRPWRLARCLFRQKVLEGIRIVFSSITHGAKRKAGAKPPSKRCFGILSIACDPNYQRASLGRLLMEESERRAIELGFKEIRLTVAAHNEKAIRFYESLGWEKVYEDETWKGEMKKKVIP